MRAVYDNAYRLFEEKGLDPKKRCIYELTTRAGLSLEEVVEICREG